MSSLTTIFSFVLIAVWVLRIFKLRPHRRANIITFIIQLLCLMVDSNGNLAVSELPSTAIGVAVFTWILHLLAKWHDRRKEKKQQNECRKSAVRFRVCVFLYLFFPAYLSCCLGFYVKL